MQSIHPNRYARLGGLLYLIIIVCGIWSEGFVRSALVMPGDPTATASRIQGAMGLFRLSFVADTIMALADVGLAVVLYVLLRPVSRPLALMAMAFRLVQAAVLGANLLNQSAVILLLSDTGLAFDPSARDSLALLFAQGHSFGYDIGLLFFGVNCLVTGYLVYVSGFLPRVIGALVVATGPVYLIGSYLRFVAPPAAEVFQMMYLLPVIAESAFCLWLLIRGVHAERWSQANATS